MQKLFYRLSAFFLALFLVLSNCLFVNAKDDELPNQYETEDYLFEKLSHKDKPVQTPDGIVDYVGNGAVSVEDEDQGDRGQSYSWASVAYGDYVYVGTCYAAMGNTLTLMDSVLGDKFDKDVMEATLNALFNGTFFYGQEDNIDSGGILVKVNVHTAEVTLLMSKTTTGQSPLFRNAVCFNDKLYFCGSVNENGVGLPSIYEVNPENDEIQCIYTGITFSEYAQAFREGICTGIRGMCEFDGRLVVSCVGLEGPYILISSNPSEGASAFQKIATKEDLFNYPAYHYSDSIYGGSIWEMVSYNGSLYVALCTGTPDNMPDENTMQSFAIVKGVENEDGTWQWTSFIGDKEKDNAAYTFGIDPSRTRSGACHLVVYNDYLYIGEYEDIEIGLENTLFKTDVRFLAANLDQSVNVYRMDKNENIELVVGDATDMFPDGSISGYGSGFGRHENQYIWQSDVFDDKLFFSTFDSSSLLEPVGQFTNGDIIHNTPEQWKSQLNYIKVLIELLIQKGMTENSEIALYSQEDPYQLVEQAINAANEHEKTMGISMLNDDEVAIALTEEQIEQMVADLLSGKIEIDSLDETLKNELYPLNELMTQWLYELEEVSNEDYVQYYEEMYNAFIALEEQVPDSLKEIYQTLLTLFAKDNLCAFVRILEYLSTATRGFDLYVSEDGENFDAITVDGFNDPYNHGLRTFASTSDWMVVGTANPFNGTQLWCLLSSNEPETEKYTLTFETNGGTSIESVEVEKGTTVDLDVYETTKEGYTFDGWYLDEACTTKVTSITMDKDVTVYAKWVEDEKETDPTDPTDPTNPEDQGGADDVVSTGDDTNIYVWVALFVISASLMGTLSLKKKYLK